MRLLAWLNLPRRAAVGLVVGVVAVGAALAAFASQDAVPLVQSQEGKPSQSADVETVAPADALGSAATGELNDTEVGTTGDDDADDAADDSEGGVNEDGTAEDGDDASEDDGDPEEGDNSADEEGDDEDEGEAVDGDDDRRDIVGIPEDNPNHGPDDEDDDCQKGETAVKVTPSGNEVRVPCHAAEPGPPGFSRGHAGDDGVEADEDPSGHDSDEDEGEEEGDDGDESDGHDEGDHDDDHGGDED